MFNFANSSTVFVSQRDGQDNYTGFTPTTDGYGNGPLKTVERAVETAKSMRVCGMRQPLTVKFIGDYYLSRPIEVGSFFYESIYGKEHVLDNITFEPYRGESGRETARIIGGKRLTGFERDNLCGHDCFSLFLPEVKRGEWCFSDLFVNGKRANAARYPKEGAFKAVTTEFSESTRKLFEGSKWFIAEKSDLEGITGIENAIVSFYDRWIDEHSPVESYDPESGLLTMKYRSRFNLTANYSESNATNLFYYLENIKQAFSAPDEWYLDCAGGMLYYIPRDDGMTPESIEAFAPTVTKLANIVGTPENRVSGIRFKNLEMLCTKGDYKSTHGKVFNLIDGENAEGFASDAQSVARGFGAVSFENASCCSISECEIHMTGLHAVEVLCGCNDIRVEGCNIHDLGGGGVKIYGGNAEEPDEMRTTHNVIRGNKITNCGKRYAAACGVLVCHSAYNEIAENEISYLDYSGVSVGWVWGYSKSTTYGNIIRKNHIHHVGMGRLSDMGGIYLLGYQSGSVVSENVIHDVTSAHYGGWGIYTDEGSSYITIEKNIVYRTKSNCYHQHYGSYNTVRNNIFAFGGNSAVLVSRRENHMAILFERNIMISDGKPMYGEANGGQFPNSGMCTQSNIYYDTTGEPVLFAFGNGKKLGLSEWQSIYGYDSGSIVADPLCANIESHDFKLLPNSPAFSVGFDEIKPM